MTDPTSLDGADTVSPSLTINLLPVEDVFLKSPAGPYGCIVCEESFPKYDRCKLHEVVAHGTLASDVRLEPPVPTRTLQNKDWRARMIGDDSQEIRYFCPWAGCRYAFSKESYVSKSRRRKGKENDVKYFKELRYLKEHYLRHHSENASICSKCGLKCRTKRELVLHQPHCVVETCCCGRRLTTRCGYLHHVRNCLHFQETKRAAGKKAEAMRVAPLAKRVGDQALYIPAAEAAEAEKEPSTLLARSVLLINSCVQTSESSMRPSSGKASKSAQCMPLSSKDGRDVGTDSLEKSQPAAFRPRIVTSSLRILTKSCSVQTSTLLLRVEPLKIDAFTQTELLDDNEGLSAQDASELLLLLDRDPRDDDVPMSPFTQTMETQTDEHELEPFLLPCNTIETQTFACGSDHVFLELTDSVSDVFLGSDVGGELLIDDLLQDCVDMETQTLEGFEDDLMWDLNDANTQTGSHSLLNHLLIMG